MKKACCLFICSLFMSLTMPSQSRDVPDQELLLILLKNESNQKVEELGWVAEWCGILNIKKAVPYLNAFLAKYQDNRYSVTEFIQAVGRIGDTSSIPFLLPNCDFDIAIQALSRIDGKWKQRPETQAYLAKLWTVMNDPRLGTPSSPHTYESALFRQILVLEEKRQKIRTLCQKLVMRKNCDLTYISEQVLYALGDAAVVVPEKEKIRTLLAKGTIKEIEDAYWPEDLSAWANSQEGISLKKRCFSILGKGDKYSERKANVLSVIFIILHPSDSAAILRLFDLYKKNLVPYRARNLLADFAQRYWAYGVVYPYAEIIRREMQEELNKKIDAHLLSCLGAWEDDPVHKQLIYIMSRSDNKLTKKDMQLCVTAMAKNDYSGLFFKLVKLYDDVDLDLKKHLLIYFAHLLDPRIRSYLERWRHNDYRDIRAFAEWAIFSLDVAEAAKVGQIK